MRIELEGIHDISIAESELDSITQSKFQKAEWQKAIEYSKKEGVVDRCESRTDVQPFHLLCELKELKKYGIGLFFYFDMLKKLAILFVFASLICGPVYYSNYFGEGLSSGSNGIGFFQRFSLSNQTKLQVLIPNSTATEKEKEEVKKENSTRVDLFVQEQQNQKKFVWIPDFAYSIIYFGFIMYYKRYSSRVESNNKTIQPSHYSLEVTGLPKNTLDLNEVRSYFNMIVQKHTTITDLNIVMEISFKKDFQDTLFLHCQEAQLIESIMIDKKKIELKKQEKQNVSSMKEDLLQKQQKLSKLQKSLEKQIIEKLGGIHDYKSYNTLSAFIIFNTIQQKQQIVTLFKKYSVQHWMIRYVFCCFRRSIPQSILFRGKYQLTLKDHIDQPSNIKWENVDVSADENNKLHFSIDYDLLNIGNRILRKICVFLVMIAVMLITLGCLISANAFQPTQGQNCPQNQYTLDETKAMQSDSAKQCYCSSQSMSTILSESAIKDYCWDFYLVELQKEVLIVLTTLIIVFANSILAVILQKLTKFLRFPTISQETTTTVILLFIATFTNTALLTLFVILYFEALFLSKVIQLLFSEFQLQANISGFIPSLYFTSPIPPLKEALNEKVAEFSPDFNREWYSSVGSKIMLTMLLSTFWPHILDLMIIPIKKRWRFWRAKQKIIQHEMNKLVIGTEFNMAWHYTSLLNIVFVALFYSSGQPLLIPCAAFALTSQYWVFKYRILRWHKKPPAFDEKLNESVLRILPWALILHLAIGAYMYGQPLIFPRNSQQLVVSISESLNQAGVYEVSVTTDQEAPAVDRAYSSSILFLLLIAVISLYIAEFTILKLLKCILQNICPCFFRSSKNRRVVNLDSKDPDRYTYAVQFKKMGQLATYDIRLNENYYSLIQAIDIGSTTHYTARSNQTQQHQTIPVSPQQNPKKSKFLPDVEQTGFNESSDNFDTKKLRIQV